MPFTPNQFHVDTALTQISVAYDNPDLVAEQVFPVVGVEKQSDIFFKFSKQHFRPLPDSISPGTDVQEMPIDMDARGNYRCEGHGLDSSMSDSLMAEADPGADLDIEITTKLVSTIRLNEEISLASMLGPGNIPNNVTLTGTAQWGDYINSDPVLAIEEQKEQIQQQTGLLPNYLNVSRPVFRTLRNHPKITDRVKYTGEGVRKALSAQQLADVLELDGVIVASGVKQTAPQGEADSMDYIWANDALLFYRPALPGKRVPALGYTFVWIISPGKNGGLRGDLDGGSGLLVRRYRWEKTRSQVLAVDFYYTQQLIDPYCGFLWHNAISS